MKMADDIHIGNSIKAELKRQDRSIAWLARQVYCDRGNMSRILSNKYVDIQILRRISLCLNYNFYKELYENMQAELKNAGKDDA